MERPEVIQKKIDLLTKQLIVSKKMYDMEHISTTGFSNDMIGFFNFANGRKILTLLQDGRKLEYSHGVYGNVDVWMNKQKNRILVSGNDGINESNILYFIFDFIGEWYAYPIDSSK